MSQLTPWVKVEEGDLFEGTLEQWEDCFFSFPNDFTTDDKLAQIQDFCHSSGFDYKVTWKNKDGLTVRTEQPKGYSCCCH
jgi:hypothetical protein